MPYYTDIVDLTMLPAVAFSWLWGDGIPPFSGMAQKKYNCFTATVFDILKNFLSNCFTATNTFRIMKTHLSGERIEFNYLKPFKFISLVLNTLFMLGFIKCSFNFIPNQFCIISDAKVQKDFKRQKNILKTLRQNSIKYKK